MVFQQKNQMAQPGRVGSDSFGDINPPQVSPLALAGPSFWTRSDRNKILKIPQKSISLIQNLRFKKHIESCMCIYIYNTISLPSSYSKNPASNLPQSSPQKKSEQQKKCLEIILSGQTSAMPPSPAHGAWFGGGAAGAAIHCTVQMELFLVGFPQGPFGNLIDFMWLSNVW